MSGFINLKITTKKDGVEVPWFNTYKGRVRTSMGLVDYRVGNMAQGRLGQGAWIRAEQMLDLGNYGVQLMIDRVSKGIGADDAAMPPLKVRGESKRWSTSQKKLAVYNNRDTGYPAFKQRLGLKPIRDLYGPGGLVLVTKMDKATRRITSSRYLKSGTALSRGFSSDHKGHMLDDIRVTYVDDNRCKIDITTTASRTKARANENRAPWWGWSPSDIMKLSNRFAEVFRMRAADRLFTFGLIGANALANSVSWYRKAIGNARRVA
jgi:hypothetical protein